MSKKYPIFLYLFVFFFFSSCTEKKEIDYPVVKGTYDASKLMDGETVELEGEWIFVPSNFVSPKNDFSKFKRYEKVSQRWDSYENPENERSYCTYAVKLINLSPNVVYAITMSECYCALRVYINGEQCFNLGRVGKNYEKEIMQLDSPLITLPTHGAKNALLMFHISNFNNKYPGFSKPIKFGSHASIASEKNKNTIVFTILAGYLFMASAFFISLYLFYSKEKKALYFGLMCANFSLRICCYDEFLITIIAPYLSSIIIFKLGYLTFTLAIILISLFINEIFKITNKIVLLILFIPAVIYLIVNIFGSPYLSASYLTYAQLYVLGLGIYDIAIVVIASIKKNKDAYLFLLGLLLFLLMAINDILVANRVLEGQFIAHFGILALLIPMSIITLSSFRDSYNRIISITKEIEETNNALSKFVPDEFMHLLNKKHVDVKLGDSALKEMYVVFIHIGLYEDLEGHENRMRALNIYNNALADINPVIEQYHGFVDKYLPEGLMLLFDGQAKDVIQCMLEIEHLIQKENVSRLLSGEEKITFSCGIHFGWIMIGTIGEEERMDSTVISDVVNVASRLHFYALQQGLTFVVSQIVRGNFIKSTKDDDVNFRYRGKVQLRGKEEVLDVYEVMEA